MRSWCHQPDVPHEGQARHGTDPLRRATWLIRTPDGACPVTWRSPDPEGSERRGGADVQPRGQGFYRAPLAFGPKTTEPWSRKLG